MIAMACLVILLDILFRKKRVEVLSAVYFGLIVGLFLSYVCGLAFEPLFPSADEIQATPYMSEIRTYTQVTLSVFLCYMCISFLLQTQGGLSVRYPLRRVFERNSWTPSLYP